MQNTHYRLRLPDNRRYSKLCTDKEKSVINYACQYINSNEKCFGMEQGVQFFLEKSRNFDSARKPFYRIPFEPVVISYWKEIGGIDFIINHVNDFVSVLTDSKSVVRTGEICARNEHGDTILFQPPNFGQWIDCLSSIYCEGHSAMVEAAFVYASTVVLHPFTDGNGRLARALLYGSLKKELGVDSPCLALAPTFDLKRRTLARSTIKLSVGKDWSGYIKSLSVLMAASALNAYRFHKARQQ